MFIFSLISFKLKEREQCLLDGEISLTQDLLNQSDNTEEADVEKENEEQLPANWVTGSWENQKYNPFNNMMSAPPVEPYTPLEYFKQLFDSKIVENIVYQTNLYSVQKNGSSINANSNKMEQFFGMHMCMSVIKMPAYRMYWAQYTKYSMISDTMSRNRFTALHTHVHFNDNTNCFPSQILDMTNFLKFGHLLMLYNIILN